MPANLGSAAFTLTADASALIRTIDDSQNKIRAATTQIAQQMGVAEQSVTKAYKQIASEQTKAVGGFSDATKGALAFGAAAAGVTIGAATIHEAMSKIATDTQAAAQATFSLGVAFKGTAGEMQRFADEQAKLAGRSNIDAQQAVASTRILATQYGYTNEQLKAVVARSADLAAATGIDLVKATKDSVAALRLEGDVAEELGLNLQQNAVQASLATKAERERYNALDPLTKSQITYAKFLEQSNFALGEAAKRANDGVGAFDKLDASTTNLSVAFGKLLQPELQGTALWFAKAADAASDFLERSGEVERAIKELKAAGTAGFTGGLIDVLTQGEKIREQILKNRAAATKTGSGEFGPSPQEVQDAIANHKILEAAERDRQAVIASTRKEARDAEAKAGEEAAQQEHDREIKRLDDQKTALEVEKAQKLKAVEANKDAALKGIEEEARAAADAADARIAHLQVEQEAAKRAASDRHDAEVAAIDATQKAEEDAVTETIRSLEIERDHAKQASEDKRDAAIRALDDEKTARDAARTEEDRAQEDALQATKRREDDRHEGVLRGLETEVKAANDKKDAELRAIDKTAKRQQDHHDDRLRQIEEESKAAHDQHDAAVRAIDDEADRDEHKHDAAIRVLDDEGRAADAAHEQTLRRLSDEGDAAQDAHDRAAREIDDQERAAQDTHDRLLREIGDEGDAAEHAHEQALRGIEERGRAEDDLHRRNLDNLDEEQRRRQDAISEQLSALDKLDRAEQDAATAARLAGAVEGAKRGVQKAESTGNLSEIEAARRELAQAQQAILDNQTKSQRDAAREQLRAQKDALKDEIDARKDAENERDRILKETWPPRSARLTIGWIWSRQGSTRASRQRRR
jgi:hypothetical protein